MSVQIDLRPPPGFEDLIVKFAFSDEYYFKVQSIVVDTGASIHEVELKHVWIEWPINLNEFGPFTEGGKETHDSVFLYLPYGPRTKVECGEETFEWARMAKKITIYQEDSPTIEDSDIHFELCKRKTELEREREK